MNAQKELGQDYLARVRYRNDLPPPPGAPKLLEIPHDGLGRFLRPGYASRLVREQPLNIDVDAEGGMPIDMVGVPGYFFGDESAIMAPENPPPVDPKDALLLRPLASLGKPTTTATHVSFLRRTEYIGTQGGGKGDQALRVLSAKKPRVDAPVKRPEVNKEDPMYIKKYVTKGFDIAYPDSRHIGPDTESEITGLKPTPAELDAWKNPVHPTNPALKPIDFYPIIPDLDSLTDDAGFLVYQFKKPPTTTTREHDDRVSTGLFRPSTLSEEEEALFLNAKAAHQQDPKNNPDPPDRILDYDFYVPHEKSDLPNLRAKEDISNPNRDDQSLYTRKTDEGVPSFRFDYIRTYETNSQIQLSDTPYLHVAMTLVDPDNDRDDTGRLGQKAAYYYPIIQNVRIQPRRNIGFSQMERPDNWEKADQIYVSIEDADPDEVGQRMEHRLALDRRLARERGWKPDGNGGVGGGGEKDELEEEEDDERDAKGDVEMAGNGNGNGNGHASEDEVVVQSLEERDASGDEDVDMEGLS